ncbi:tetratricopeptide repeat protein [Pelagicoccus enzymogenes]|uniref:tetratricopeptide repeat protein n=1 Tax=Pelagicoccus enzymogenes TaxID=2773457 RepID=UPI00280DFF3B|nr:tetratricopeptide repeat protein [Pelagicoccus enzymogenes]MDQ8198801.1 tetratricopeptide repeat protein [Pelagicoccus enzymogenes]
MKLSTSLLGALCLASASLSAQTYPLSENFWSNPEFKDRVMGSYGTHSELEPRLNDEEGQFFKTLIVVLEANLEQGAILLEERVTSESSAALDFMLGTIRMQLGQMDKAVSSYETAIKKFPNFMRAYKNLGIAYVQSGELEKGTETIIKGMELGGADGLSYGLLGYSYLNQGNYSSALNAYSLALAFQPASKDWKLGKIRCLMELGSYGEAAGLVSELITKDSSNHELYLHQANIALAQDRIEAALANLEISRRLGKGDENSLFLLADIYANRSMFDLAIDAYRDALEATQNKTSRFKSFNRAISAFIDNQAWEEALRLNRIAMDGFGADLDEEQRLSLLNLRAEIELGSNDSDAAAKTLEEIIEANPMNGRAIVLLAKHSWKNKDYEEAAFLYQRAENIEAVSAQAFLQYGQMLVEQKDYAEAAKKLRRSLDLNYESNVADYLRAVEEAASRS